MEATKRKIIENDPQSLDKLMINHAFSGRFTIVNFTFINHRLKLLYEISNITLLVQFNYDWSPKVVTSRYHGAKIFSSKQSRMFVQNGDVIHNFAAFHLLKREEIDQKGRKPL